MRLPHLLRVAVAAFALALPLVSGEAEAQAPPASQPPAPGDVVTQVQNFYDKAQSFQSDFSQEFLVKAYNQTKSSSGHVVFAKPGKMSWAYSNPAGNRVVSDGSTVSVYTASDKQMYQSAINQSQYPAAVSFLTGQGKLSDAFNFQLMDGDDSTRRGTQIYFPGGWILIGTPKTATPSYQKVLFYVDKATSQVRRVLIVDGQGNLNKFTFENPHVNDPVDPAQFTFTPPPGTNIVHP
jgi:outer membrane lipoprotein carrier protein